MKIECPNCKQFKFGSRGIGADVMVVIVIGMCIGYAGFNIGFLVVSVVIPIIMAIRHKYKKTAEYKCDHCDYSEIRNK